MTLLYHVARSKANSPALFLPRFLIYRNPLMRETTFDDCKVSVFATVTKGFPLVSHPALAFDRVVYITRDFPVPKNNAFPIDLLKRDLTSWTSNEHDGYTNRIR